MSFGLGVGGILKVLELAKGLRDRYQDAPDQLDSLSREIVSIQTVLESIDRVKHRLSSYEVAALEAPINECEKLLGEIKKIYDAGEATGQQPVTWKDRIKRLRVSSDYVQKLLLRVSLNVQVLNAIRQFGDSEAVQAVKENVDYLSDEPISHQRREILEWLSTTDYEPQHRGHMESRAEGTGQWLLDSEEFKSWRSERGKGLLCPGDPGSGKTIMTSIVIDELSRQFPDENTAIAYVFCNAKDQTKQTFYHVLSSLAKQLTHASLPAKLVSTFEEHQKKGTSRSENETLSLLHELIAMRPRVFILVDALDECSADVRQKLLPELFRIQCGGGANIFATTRDIPEIVSDPGLGRCDSLRIRANNDDVLRFVVSQIPRMQRFVQKRPDIQAKIKDVVSRKADGMFLLASLVMNFLRRKKRPKDVLNALDDLPTAYDNYYDEAWRRIKGQDPDEAGLATKVISWVVCARKPLGIADLQYALAAENESQIDEDSVFPEETITSVCAGLVRLDERKKIRLVHQTIQEYFEDKRDEIFTDMEATMATTCIRYLSLDQTIQYAAKAKAAWDDGERSAREWVRHSPVVPFSKYAVIHWHSHARHSQDVPSGLADFLCDPEALQAFRILFVVNHREARTWRYQKFILPEARAHIAAFFGITHVFRDQLLPPEEFVWLDDTHIVSSNTHVVSDDADVISDDTDVVSDDTDAFHDIDVVCDGTDGNPRLPLYWAAYGGHVDLVKFFLDLPSFVKELKSTDQSRPSRGPPGSAHHSLQAAFRRAMRRAVEVGSATLVRRFLDFCAREEVHAEVTSDGCDPLLSVASQRRSESRSIVRALLRLGEPQQTAVPEPLSPRRGLETPLEFGIDLGAKGEAGETPLLYTVKADSADADVVRRLLEFDGTSFQAGSGRKTLGIGAQDAGGRTALWYSAFHGSLKVLETLLAHGADPEDEDNAGQTALFAAAKEGHHEVVRYLVRGLGMDANQRDSGGERPLKAVIREVSRQDFDFWSWNPQIQVGYVETIKVLLEELKGDDVKYANQAVLLGAVTSGAEGMVDFMLGQDPVDLNWRYESGETLLTRATLGRSGLRHASVHGSFLMRKKLLDLGAELDGSVVEVLPTGSKRCRGIGGWLYLRGGRWVGPGP